MKATMRSAAALYATVLPLLATLAQSASSQDEILQVRAKEVVLSDGSRLENGVVVVRNGKIERVGKLDLDDTKPFLEHDGVLTAGLIACQTLSGMGTEAHDGTRSLLPEARIAHAHSPRHSDFEKALEVGITSVVLTPTDENLAGGLTAVVKTAGGTVVAKEAHLTLSFSVHAFASQPQRFGRFFSGEDDGAAEDGGLEDTESDSRSSRSPTSYAGALLALDRRLEDETGAFSRAAKGQLPVLLTAWDRNEVARAARFASANRLAGAIRGAPLAADPGLLPLIRASKLAVVLGPFAVGHKTRALEAVKALQDAGVPVGFALDAPSSAPANFRLTAALAIAAGADRTEVLRSMTIVGARIAGVESRVGSLEAGKDADFVLWSGDPLDLSSRVEAVFVDGKPAWRNR